MPHRLPLRKIAGFAVRYLATYAVLAWPAWSVISGGYRGLFCAMGNTAFASVGGAGSVRFVPDPQPGASFDTLLIMTNRNAPGTVGEMNQSSRNVGYLPTVALIALVIATPISWRRRRRALAIGLLLVSTFVLLRMALPIIRDFSNPDALRIFHPRAIGRWILGFANPAFLQAPASQFVCPILIWALVAFRREDWAIVHPPEAAPPNPA